MRRSSGQVLRVPTLTDQAGDTVGGRPEQEYDQGTHAEAPKAASRGSIETRHFFTPPRKPKLGNELDVAIGFPHSNELSIPPEKKAFRPMEGRR